MLLAGDPLFTLARRHMQQLAADFRDRLGYSLQVSTDTARLYKRLRLAQARALTVPPRTLSESRRPIDERRLLDARRCLMVCVTCAVLERRTLWTQVPLTELAQEIAREARSLELKLDWKRAADRAALLDGLAWLSALGVLTLRSGAEGAFGEGVDEAAEAYYDIDRPRLRACSPIRCSSPAPSQPGTWSPPPMKTASRAACAPSVSPAGWWRTRPSTWRISTSATASTSSPSEARWSGAPPTSRGCRSSAVARAAR